MGNGTTSEAVELFVERAQAVSPAFDLGDAANSEAVIDICQRLDGIALGIELAAARMVAMSPRDVCDRLDDRFRLLAGARRGSNRHRTLRNAVAWSYELLHEGERRTLNLCAVFADGFDLAAATAVCGGGDLDELGVLDMLDSLVRKSLLTIEHASGRVRYGMLETIRQFAEEQMPAGEALARRARPARRLLRRTSGPPLDPLGKPPPADRPRLGRHRVR